MIKTRIDSKLDDLRTMVAEIDNDLVEERWACRRAITRAENAEARVKELEGVINKAINYENAGFPVGFILAEALKGKVEP